MLDQTKFSLLIDNWLQKIGRVSSWIWLLLLAVIVANVILRYAFGSGRVEFEEIQWHLYSVGFLMGLSFANLNDAHITVGVLKERLTSRTQAWVELYGILLLLLPFIFLILFYSIPFVLVSFDQNEISQAPGGLPSRWIIKSMLPIGFALLALSVIARLTRVWVTLFKPQREGPKDDR